MLCCGCSFGSAVEPRPADTEQPQVASSEGVIGPSVEFLSIERPLLGSRPGRRERTSLRRSGDGWKIEEPVTADADEVTVTRMLDALWGLGKARSVASQGSRAALEGFEPTSAIEITVVDGGRGPRRVVLGPERRGKTYFKVDGKTGVFELDGRIRRVFDRELRQLRKRSITRFDPAQIERVKLSNAKGELEFERAGEDRTFHPIGRTFTNFDVVRAEQTASVLAMLSAVDFVDEDPGPQVTGLRDGAARVTFTVRENKTTRVRSVVIGSAIEARRLRYLKTQRSPQIFLVHRHIVDFLIARAGDFSRTDEEIRALEQARKFARAHAAEHQKRKNQAARDTASHESTLPERYQITKPLPETVIQALRRADVRNDADRTR